MLKGTEDRTAFEIAQSMESVGGYLMHLPLRSIHQYARCLDTELRTSFGCVMIW